MYLTASRFINREALMKTKLQINGEQNAVVRNVDVKNTWREIGDLEELRFHAGYWRQANAIHRWFISHVQDGQDDCREYRVSHKQLKDLLRTVNEVLDDSYLVAGKVTNGYRYDNGMEEPLFEAGYVIADPGLAKKLLPIQEGFYFGTTGYDQWYVEDLELTKTILEQALAQPQHVFHYRSSW